MNYSGSAVSSAGMGESLERIGPRLPLQRIGPLTRLPQLLRQFGLDPGQVLSLAALPATALDQPNERYAFSSLSRLLSVGTRLSGCSHFALLSGRATTVADLGDVGELVMSAATVGQALRRLAVYQQLNSQGALVYVTEKPPLVELGYAIYDPTVEDHKVVYDHVSAQMLGLMRELCGPAWVPNEVLLPRDAPAQAQHYQRFFKCRLTFDAEVCAIRFPQAVMAQPLRSADPVRSRAAEARLLTLDRPTLLQATRRAIRLLLLHGKTSGDETAAMLSLHRRTLNRRLSEEGLTFRNLLTEVQLDLARQLLLNTTIKIDDVGEAVGFSSTGSFMRAFKRGTGMSPRKWEEQHRPVQ